jgi:hypothetical protein
MKFKILVATLALAIGFAIVIALRDRQLVAEIARNDSELHKTSEGDVRRKLATRSAVGTVAADNQNVVYATSFEKLWSDPSWREARFKEAYVRVESQDGRALQKLVGWSPERLEALKRQLANADLSVMHAAMPDIAPVTDAERKAVSDNIRAVTETYQEQLRQTMGDADYSVFNAAQQMEPYRQSVDEAANAMRANNVQVNSDMEESMLAAYSGAAQEAAVQNSATNSAQLDDAQRAALKEQQDQAFHLILMKRMSAVLNETQLQVFMAATVEREGGG